MYESTIAADHLKVAATSGFPPEIDALAERNLAGHRFLRASWYRAGSPDAGRTLLLRGTDGAPLAAIPTVPFGPAITGARKVPGSYWPLRSPLISPDCDIFELAHALEHAAARSLGSVWRIGPARRDDPAIALLIGAAHLANWRIVARPAGTSWVVDLDKARKDGWPRASRARKLRAAWRKLCELGTPHWRQYRGSEWNAGVLEAMGRIEAQSWIVRKTDGRGAKFLTAAQRGLWQDALRDPVIAESLVATILTLDDRPVTFSFDLDDGPVRYGIASSYAEDLKSFNIGKLVNSRVLEEAIGAGQRLLDLGVGDSGYKAQMGAAEGYAMTDLLFVRSPAAALLLARVWGKELLPDYPGTLALRSPAHG